MMDNKEKDPKRKYPRIKNYDYSNVGAYFITVCTSQRRNYFWKSVVGASIARPQHPMKNFSIVGACTARPQNPFDIKLSEYGKIADNAINNIEKIYPNVTVDNYVIMPDHIHLILIIHADEYGRAMHAPTAMRVIQQMKGYITKQIGLPIWQKSFFDHIIRNREDYEKHVKYIYENPLRFVYQ